MRAVITYCTEGQEELVRDHTIRLGISKVVSLKNNVKLFEIFKELKIDVELKSLPHEDVTTISDIITKVIISLRLDGYDSIIFLSTIEPTIIIAMYIVACIRKVKVITPVTKGDGIHHLELPLFPFVELEDNERFILDRIHQLVQENNNEEITTKRLFKYIGKEFYAKLYSKTGLRSRNKELAVRKQIQRMVNKLRAINLVDIKREGKFLLLKPTSFGELICKQLNNSKI